MDALSFVVGVLTAVVMVTIVWLVVLWIDPKF